jgi:RNA polymerase sigma factor (sigma-70 family)
MAIPKGYYKLELKNNSGKSRCFATFVDGSGIERTVEINRSTYLKLSTSNHIEERLRKIRKRKELPMAYVEFSAGSRDESADDLSEQVFARMLSEQIWQALFTLPKLQRKRFLLHHYYDLTYREVGDIEGCCHSSIYKSVKAAEVALKKILKNFGDQGEQNTSASTNR